MNAKKHTVALTFDDQTKTFRDELGTSWTCEYVGLGLQTLRVANVARVEEVFHPLNSWTPAEWACAMSGEAGEVCNAVKKLRRLQDGTNTEKDPQTEEACIVAIGKEIADTIIYLDLLAARLGINLSVVVPAKFDEVSQRMNSTIQLRPALGNPAEKPMRVLAPVDSEWFWKHMLLAIKSEPHADKWPTMIRIDDTNDVLVLHIAPYSLGEEIKKFNAASGYSLAVDMRSLKEQLEVNFGPDGWSGRIRFSRNIMHAWSFQAGRTGNATMFDIFNEIKGLIVPAAQNTESTKT